MTMGQGQSKENVKKWGEAFTPPQATFKMVLFPEIRDALKDWRYPLVDPGGVGQGQFPATELVLRMFYNIDQLDDKEALRELYTIAGIDIQEESIEECKTHMLATFCDAFEFFTGKKLEPLIIMFAASIIAHNFIVGDSLNDLDACLDRLGFPYNKNTAPEPKSKKKKPPKESRQLTLF